MFWSEATYANVVIDSDRIASVERNYNSVRDLLVDRLYQSKLALLEPQTELYAIPGSPQDALVQVRDDLLLLQGSATSDDDYVCRRLGSTVIEGVMRRLFT